MWENDFSDHKKNENNSEHQDVTVMQAKQTLSAYELYWKPSNSVENSNGMVHPDGNFPDKSNTFQGIIFFPFFVPFVWLTSAARLPLEAVGAWFVLTQAQL